MSDTLRLPAFNDVLPLLLDVPLASPELASAILGALADAVVVYDAAGRILGGNPAAVALLGLQLPGRQAALAVPIGEREGGVDLLTLQREPLSREEWPAMRVLHGERLTGARTVDVLARSIDGQERILNISGAPLLDTQGQILGAVCVCRDISERIHLERELAERAAELESIFATQEAAVVFADTNGRIVRMNDAQRQLLRMRGVDPEVGRIETWAEQTAPCDERGLPIPHERLPFYRALRGETVTGAQAVELHQRIGDGQDMVLRVSAAPVRDVQGQIVGAVLTSYDVTPQRRLERQRLAIMRVVAHDLANPLAAVRLYLQMQQHRLERGEPLFTPDDQLLSQLDYGLMRMQRLIDDLRVATQVELGTLDLQRKAHDVAALCREEAAAQQAVSGREVRVQIPSEPVGVIVDGERLGQVIANLLSNALKYSPSEQPVGVTVRVDRGQAVVEVHDAGPGIPAHEQQHLFEQFHRVAGIRPHDGSSRLGLGLYISKGIIERHGGQIGVRSAVGSGSTFWFTLPLVTAPGSTPLTHSGDQ